MELLVEYSFYIILQKFQLWRTNEAFTTSLGLKLNKSELQNFNTIILEPSKP